MRVSVQVWGAGAAGANAHVGACAGVALLVLTSLSLSRMAMHVSVCVPVSLPHLLVLVEVGAQRRAALQERLRLNDGRLGGRARGQGLVGGVDVSGSVLVHALRRGRWPSNGVGTWWVVGRRRWSVSAMTCCSQVRHIQTHRVSGLVVVETRRLRVGPCIARQHGASLVHLSAIVTCAVDAAFAVPPRACQATHRMTWARRS